MLRQTKRFSVLRSRQPEEENGLLGWLEGLLGNKKEHQEGENETKEEKEAKNGNESEEEKKKPDSDNDSDGDGGIMIPIPRGLAGLFYFKSVKNSDRIYLPLQHQWQDPRLSNFRGVKRTWI